MKKRLIIVGGVLSLIGLSRPTDCEGGVLNWLDELFGKKPDHEEENAPSNISAEEVKRLMAEGRLAKAIILDGRTPEEYAVGHILGSLNLPLNILEERQEELDRDKSIIVYCKSGCSRSPKACRMLKQHGFNRVKNMFGGITEWGRIGGEIEGNFQEEKVGQTKMPVWELGHGCED